MLSSTLVFAAISSFSSLVQAQKFEFVAYDDNYSAGCNEKKPWIYRVAYERGVCYKGSPNLVNGLYYGFTTCQGATDGSFMFQGYNGTISETTDATIVMKHFTDSACASPVTPFVSTSDALSANKGCIVSSLNFAYPIKVKITNEPFPYSNGSIAVPFIACSFPSSTVTATSTSTAATSTGSAASSVTGTTSSATGTATTISTSSTASKTGSVISSGSPVTGSMLAVAAVAIIMSSIM